MKICDHIYPIDYLKNYKEEPVVKKLLNQSNLSTLDLGCFFPAVLCILFHDYNFKTLFGVEQLTHEEIVEAYNEQAIEAGKKKFDFKTLYEVYCAEIIFNPDDPFDQGKTYLPEEDFHKNIILKAGQTADEYLVSDNQSFDFIILSNILHLIDPRLLMWVCRMVYGKLNKDGLIYIRVTSPENPVAIKSRHNTFTEQKIRAMVGNFNEISFCKRLNKENNGIESFVFFGSKK